MPTLKDNVGCDQFCNHGRGNPSALRSDGRTSSVLSAAGCSRFLGDLGRLLSLPGDLSALLTPSWRPFLKFFREAQERYALALGQNCKLQSTLEQHQQTLQCIRVVGTDNEQKRTRVLTELKAECESAARELPPTAAEPAFLESLFIHSQQLVVSTSARLSGLKRNLTERSQRAAVDSEERSEGRSEIESVASKLWESREDSHWLVTAKSEESWKAAIQQRDAQLQSYTSSSRLYVREKR